MIIPTFYLRLAFMLYNVCIVIKKYVGETSHNRQEWIYEHKRNLKNEM